MKARNSNKQSKKDWKWRTVARARARTGSDAVALGCELIIVI